MTQSSLAIGVAALLTALLVYAAWIDGGVPVAPADSNQVELAIAPDGTVIVCGDVGMLTGQQMLGGRIVLRVAIGNLRTTADTLATAWRLVREAAADLRSTGG